MCRLIKRCTGRHIAVKFLLRSQNWLGICQYNLSHIFEVYRGRASERFIDTPLNKYYVKAEKIDIFEVQHYLYKRRRLIPIEAVSANAYEAPHKMRTISRIFAN